MKKNERAVQKCRLKLRQGGREHGAERKRGREKGEKEE